MFDERALGATPPVLLPKAAVLRKFLQTIITKHVELLPFVVLQLCMALRRKKPGQRWEIPCSTSWVPAFIYLPLRA